MFWYGWNSWIVETMSGLATSLAAYAATRNVGGAMAAAVGLSAAYEYAIDPNGWSWTDVGQRQVGILIGLCVWPATLSLLGL